MSLMLLSEIFKIEDEEPLLEGAKIAWGRVGSKVVKKFRCTAGRRQGRLVSHPSQCNKPVDIKKRVKFRQTKLAKGLRMQKKRKRTLSRNPASLRVQRMNKAMG